MQRCVPVDIRLMRFDRTLWLQKYTQYGHMAGTTAEVKRRVILVVHNIDCRGEVKRMMSTFGNVHTLKCNTKE